MALLAIFMRINFKTQTIMKRFLKFMFAAIALTGMMTACGGDKGGGETPTPGTGMLVLSIDRVVLLNDGEQSTRFTVEYDGEDVTQQAQIMLGGVELDESEFVSTESGTYKFRAKYDGVTSNEATVIVYEDAGDLELVLSVDKTTFLANNTDFVTFYLKINGEDVDLGAMIASGEILLCDPASSCLNEPKFSCDYIAAGDYVYTAKLTKGFDTVASSNDVNLIAQRTDGDLVIIVSKDVIQGDGVDNTELTVTFNGRDITFRAVIKKDGQIFEDFDFSSTVAGVYEFTAEYNGQTSDPVTVTVEAVESATLSITANRSMLAGDGEDVVTFTVMYGVEDVTADAVIKKNGSPLTGTVFASDIAGDFTFTAEYTPVGQTESIVSEDAVEVKAVESEAFDAGRRPYKNVLFHVVTETTCMPCVTLKGNLEEAPTSAGGIIPVYLYYNGPTKLVMGITNTNYAQELRDNGREGGYQLFTGRYPTGTTELTESFEGNYAVDDIRTEYYNPYVHVANPPKTGVRVVSMTDDLKVYGVASVGASVAGNYRVAVILVEDDVIATQRLPSGVTDPNYSHKGVFRNCSGNGLGTELGDMAVGDVKSAEFSISIRNSNYTRANLSLVVYSLYKEGAAWRVSNAVKLPIGDTKAYAYAD